MRRRARPSPEHRPVRRSSGPRPPLALPLVVLGLGVFLLVLAPLLAWYVEPRAQRTPVDIDTTTVFTGTGTYFDTERIEPVSGKKLTITRQVRGDVADSERSGRAVWDVSTSVDSDKSLPAADPHDSLQWTVERWVTDRRTNKPVHCCQEEPYFEGEAYLKFPFDVQKRSYIWWDNTLGSTVTLKYDGKKRIQGYEGLKFTGTVPATKTGTRLVPGSLVGVEDVGQVLAEEWYANHGIELVADQRTGRIIYAAIGPRKTLRAPGGEEDAVTLLDSKRIAFDTETQKEQVELADSDSGLLRLVGRTLPLVAGITGFVLAVTGAVLVARRRPRPEAHESSQQSLTM
ncbi:DUF3068 domain-containing protein [Streptomyces beigongshangae]|uniref:DUF3068 domain-containing protein n=1 Tax=Streptomyces beigongshangae TaxID=2841597 RepID=UPI001C843C62|nr:DUF3068 domain-containing protein [Streptomyces sp. REN17]